MTAYKHYNLVPTADGVAVYDPRYPAKPLHVAKDAASARSFVTAHRDGVAWAAQAAQVS